MGSSVLVSGYSSEHFVDVGDDLLYALTEFQNQLLYEDPSEDFYSEGNFKVGLSGLEDESYYYSWNPSIR